MSSTKEQGQLVTQLGVTQRQECRNVWVSVGPRLQL